MADGVAKSGLDKAAGRATALPFAASLILRLLLWRGPAAIVWRVIAIVVDSIKAFTAWPLAHVCQERLERVCPPSAYGYSSTAVVLEPGMVAIGGSLLHVAPCNVCGGPSQSMLESFGPTSGVALTAAGDGLAGLKISGLCARSATAVADAKPKSFCSTLASVFNGDKFTETPPTQVELSHAANYNAVSYVLGAQKWQMG